jgi:hypothetical protein
VKAQIDEHEEQETRDDLVHVVDDLFQPVFRFFCPMNIFVHTLHCIGDHLARLDYFIPAEFFVESLARKASLHLCFWIFVLVFNELYINMSMEDYGDPEQMGRWKGKKSDGLECVMIWTNFNVR